MQTLAGSFTIAPGSNRTGLRNWFGCSNLALFLYVGFCLVLSTATYLRPLPTFDRYLYAGAVASLRYSDPATIHRIARSEFDAQPSPFRFESVAAEPYFADVRDNPDHFVQQLGLFRVKLGYVAAGYVLWSAGLPILVGLRVISASCIFAVGLIVLAWSRDVVLSALLLLTPTVLSMGRMVTADPLSTLIILLALFALAKSRDVLAACLLGSSILVRSDNVVLTLILLAWMVWQQRMPFLRGALFGALSAVSAGLVNHIAGIYGWQVIMRHGIIKPEIEPINHPILISFAGYLTAIVGLRAILYTFMTIWILVGAVAWKHLPPNSTLRELLVVAAASILVRLVMFPNFDDRFFVWAYLLAGIALIQTTRRWNSDVKVGAA
jgi:hypothetical protein